MVKIFKEAIIENSTFGIRLTILGKPKLTFKPQSIRFSWAASSKPQNVNLRLVGPRVL